MPTYKVTDPTTGKIVTLTGDSPPTEAELTQIFQQVTRRPAETGPAMPTSPPGGDALIQNLKNVAMAPVHLAQGVGHLIAAHPAATGALALSVPMGLATGGLSIPAAMGAVGLAGAGGAGAGLAASQVATRDTAPAPTVAGNVQTMAEQGALAAGGEGLARGASAALQAMPRVSRAAGNFQTVMNAAKDVPVDIEAPGKAALATMQLADRGGTMPRAVNKFIQYVTDPKRGDFTYAEARDFASNISRLSASDYQKLTPVMARSVADLRVALNQSVADAAQQAGKGAEYRAAMTEYAQAMRVRDAIDAAVAGAKRGLPYASATAVGAGVGAWLTSRVRSLLGP